jgi:uncharacterized protein (DUF111 family)
VLALLTGAPVQAGPVPREMTTPDRGSTADVVVDAFGPAARRWCCAAADLVRGSRPRELANVLRLVLGEPVEHPADSPRCCSARTWTTSTRGCGPGVLQALLAAARTTRG